MTIVQLDPTWGFQVQLNEVDRVAITLAGYVVLSTEGFLEPYIALQFYDLWDATSQERYRHVARIPE